MGWLEFLKPKQIKESTAPSKTAGRREALGKLKESLDSWQMFDFLRDRYYGNGQWYFPVGGLPAVGGTTNKIQGRNQYVFYTEQDLRFQRDAARILYASEPVAKAIEGNLNAFVVGKGMKYKLCLKKGFEAKATEEQLQEYQQLLDAWMDTEQWPEREQECFTAKVVDGEYFLRAVKTKGRVRTIRIEPEHIQNPEGVSFEDGWWLGVKYDPKDYETPIAYGYKLYGQEWEEIPAEEIIHFKSNVSRNVSRGVSDFYPILDDLDSIAKLSDNMRAGATAQAEIAYMMSVENATPNSINTFADEQAEVTLTNPVTGMEDKSRRSKPGTVKYHGDNVKFTTMPQGASQGYIEVYQNSMRIVASAFCMPEYMLTSDASNANYSSTLVAGTPFYRYVEKLQNLLKRPFKQVMMRVLDSLYADAQIPTELRAYLDIDVTCDSPVVVDPYQDAQRRDIELRNGVISPQMWAMEQGRDPQKVQQQIDEWRDANMGAVQQGGMGGQQQGNDGGMSIPKPGADGLGMDGVLAKESAIRESSWEEQKHPRDGDGKFANKGGSGREGEKAKIKMSLEGVTPYKDMTQEHAATIAMQRASHPSVGIYFPASPDDKLSIIPDVNKRIAIRGERWWEPALDEHTDYLRKVTEHARSAAVGAKIRNTETGEVGEITGWAFERGSGKSIPLVKRESGDTYTIETPQLSGWEVVASSVTHNTPLEAFSAVAGHEYASRMGETFARYFAKFDGLPEKEKAGIYRSIESQGRREFQSELGAKVSYASMYAGLTEDGMRKVLQLLKPPIRESSWEEQKHPRASDGRFGHVSGAHGGKANVVSKADLDTHIKASKGRELYRGVPKKEHAKQFETGELRHGKGAYGHGIYVGYGYNGRDTASNAAGDEGHLARMSLSSDAKTITWNDAEEMWNKEGKEQYSIEKHGSSENAIAQMMRERGYDAIDVEHNEFMNVLNPEALVVENPGGVGEKPEQATPAKIDRSKYGVAKNPDLEDHLDRLAASEDVSYIYDSMIGGWGKYGKEDNDIMKAMAKDRLAMLGYSNPYVVKFKGKKGWEKKVIDDSEMDKWRKTEGLIHTVKGYGREAHGDFDDNTGSFTGGVSVKAKSKGDTLDEGVVVEVRLARGKAEYLVKPHTKASKAKHEKVKGPSQLGSDYNPDR